MPPARTLTPELMDDPSLDPSEHMRALTGLARLNRISRSANTLLEGVARILEGRTRATLLDVATGSGDLAIELHRLAKHRGLDLTVHACDISDRALDRARRDAERDGADIRFFQHDAIRGEPLPESDIVTCSLFLHHLTRDEALTLLARMRHSARLGVVVNDLRRTRAGVALAYLASRLFTRSRVVHTDALKSARAAWTIEETLGLLAEANMHGTHITPRWPARFLATWNRPATERDHA